MPITFCGPDPVVICVSAPEGSCGSPGWEGGGEEGVNRCQHSGAKVEEDL